MARRRDIRPAGSLPGRAIVAAALAQPRTEEDLVALPVWGGRSMRRQTAQWLPAITAALELPEADLPDPRPARRATAGAVLAGPGTTGRGPAVRVAVRGRRGGRAARHAGREPARPGHRPPAVLGAARRPAGRGAVADVLRAHGARPWQVELTASVLADAIAGARVPEPDPVPDAPE